MEQLKIIKNELDYVLEIYDDIKNIYDNLPPNINISSVYNKDDLLRLIIIVKSIVYVHKIDDKDGYFKNIIKTYENICKVSKMFKIDIEIYIIFDDYINMISNIKKK